MVRTLKGLKLTPMQKGKFQQAKRDIDEFKEQLAIMEEAGLDISKWDQDIYQKSQEVNGILKVFGA